VPVEFDLGKLPVRPEIYDLPEKFLNLKIKPYQSRSSFSYDSDKASKRWYVLNDLLGVFLIDGQEKLKERKNRNLEASKQFVVTEDSVTKLSTDNTWKNKDLKEGFIEKWAKLVEEE